MGGMMPDFGGGGGGSTAWYPPSSASDSGGSGGPLPISDGSGAGSTAWYPAPSAPSSGGGSGGPLPISNGGGAPFNYSQWYQNYLNQLAQASPLVAQLISTSGMPGAGDVPAPNVSASPSSPTAPSVGYVGGAPSVPSGLTGVAANQNLPTSTGSPTASPPTPPKPTGSLSNPAGGSPNTSKPAGPTPNTQQTNPVTIPLQQATGSLNQTQEGIGSTASQANQYAQQLLNMIPSLVPEVTKLIQEMQTQGQNFSNLAQAVSQQLQQPLMSSPQWQAMVNQQLDRLRQQENAIFQSGLQQLGAQGILRGGAPEALLQNLAQNEAGQASGLLRDLAIYAQQTQNQNLLQALQAASQGLTVPNSLNQQALSQALNFLGLGGSLLGTSGGLQSALLNSLTGQFNTLSQLAQQYALAQAQQQIQEQQFPLMLQALQNNALMSLGGGDLSSLLPFLTPGG